MSAPKVKYAEHADEAATAPGSGVTYDNTTSGLTADNVQAAIDEVAAGANAVSSVNSATGAVVLDGGDVLLTGYTIAEAAAAIAATDTINGAFGKLQKTVDGIETLLAGI